jgi:hypothetical protein
MKKLFLVAAFLISGATLSMATSNVKIEDPKKKKKEAKKEDTTQGPGQSTFCTVNVSGIIITAICSCTKLQACDLAYSIARRELQ